MQNPLQKNLRGELERTVKSARDVAETAAAAVLAQLAVGEGKAPEYLSAEQKALRRRLRAHGRALGDGKQRDESQELRRLIWEVAYEHWHRMLFARFLAENGLLLWEPGAAVSLDDCRDMVDHHPKLALGARSHWELAGKLAARMLPQVFKPASPVFELTLAPEHQRALEKLLANLPAEVFQASDSLGWVYQFWQAKRKDEVNASGDKIGADELPAVTQLFTEPYMVDFLLHNSLGAWWALRQLQDDDWRLATSEEDLRQRLASHGIALPYLRLVRDASGERWQPAAGDYAGWPNKLADFKLLDPCCGSGHFLVAAFLLLVPMRMSEGLNAIDAVDAVLADNLHGLEIDPRCVEIAVFALALAAWRYRDEDGNPLGVRADMPAPQVACCGLKVAARPEDWMALVPDATPHADYVRQELRLLHASFAQAPLLGSLLDPARSLKNDLASTSFDTLRDLLERALATETPATLWGAGSHLNEDAWDLAISAQGLLEAARLLAARYHLVLTNVPYLTRGKQNDTLKQYCETHYPEAKNDLANVFLERCLELSRAQGEGVVQIVMPQNWLFLTSYKKQRESLLRRVQWNLLARLGPGAFETISGEVVQAILLAQTSASAQAGFQLRGVDASALKSALEKANALRDHDVASICQQDQLANPDATISLGALSGKNLLRQFAVSIEGLSTGDGEQFLSRFWEAHWRLGVWEPFIQSVDQTDLYGGRSEVVRWERGAGALHSFPSAYNFPSEYMNRRRVLGKAGLRVTQMQNFACTIYEGEVFGKNGATVIPHESTHLPALWCFVASAQYGELVREIDQSLKVTVGSLLKVPFDVAKWQIVAAERYPNGLPKPYSDDPTQWLFHGHPQPATDPLQVAVARLTGYRWPAETDKAMELADEARTWIAHCDKLAEHTDDDGIVCLSSVRGEPPAHERLEKLLIAAWETVHPGSWKPAVLDKLLADADCAGKSLEVWLRDKFFEQHARRFHHRPFVWHIWDGLKDGFAALVNYHKLDVQILDRLIHTYLGDWIRDQEDGVRRHIDGAALRLSAAQNLKVRLHWILGGEAPYDIFVRWKPLDQQAIGWHPDLNDGVRLNIRPFMTAEVLRHNKKPKLNITWDKDRGKDVESAPWYKVFHGDRINDHHLTLAEKRSAGMTR